VCRTLGRPSVSGTRAGVSDTRPGVSNLDVGVDDDLGEAEDLAAEMERVAEPRLLPLLVRYQSSAFRVPGRSRSTVGEAYLKRKPETRTALPETHDPQRTLVVSVLMGFKLKL